MWGDCRPLAAQCVGGGIYIVVLERERVRGTKGGGGARPATRNARRAVSSRARKRTERSKRRACNRVGVKGWGKGVRVSAMFAHELFSLRGLASVTQKSSRAMTCYALRTWFAHGRTPGTAVCTAGGNGKWESQL